MFAHQAFAPNTSQKRLNAADDLLRRIMTDFDPDNFTRKELVDELVSFAGRDAQYAYTEGALEGDLETLLGQGHIERNAEVHGAYFVTEVGKMHADNIS